MKRFTPLALLFGMLTALLLGSASIAQAGPLDFDCTNVVNVGVVCQSDILNDLTVTVEDNNILSGNQISILENSLDDVDVNILNPNIYLGNLEVDVVEVYDNEFNIPITVSDVNACFLNVLNQQICL